MAQASADMAVCEGGQCALGRGNKARGYIEIRSRRALFAYCGGEDNSVDITNYRVGECTACADTHVRSAPKNG